MKKKNKIDRILSFNPGIELQKAERRLKALEKYYRELKKGPKK